MNGKQRASHAWLKDCVSVDVETAGPFPARYALLSIGACMVTDPGNCFYVELKPDRNDFEEEALSISGLSMEELQRSGTPPEQAMRSFNAWLEGALTNQPIFVAFNAPFDWMFVNDYFLRYLASNPFGHSAIDIKALYLGHTGVDWKDTSMANVKQVLGIQKSLSHHALEDARDQAKLFLEILERVEENIRQRRE